jgi:hypothetical protein
MQILLRGAPQVAAAGLALAVILVTIVPAQAHYRYLRAASYGHYGPFGAYGYASYRGYRAYGYYRPYRYYLPAELRRSYDRNSTAFNS